MKSAQKKLLTALLSQLNKSLAKLSFKAPVTHVYNPLLYAAQPSEEYLDRYLCGEPGRTLLLGMNPGPWGMAQTGVPFGEIDSVKNWLGISGKVGKPSPMHPKRPIEGFSCTRSEVSGRRLWGFFAEKFERPESFAQNYLIFNYCPLIFLEESGRNRTPDKLPKTERDPLFAACDDCLKGLLEVLEIETAFGVGKFAEKRLKAQLGKAHSLKQVSSILHPSPASPAANRGWAEAVEPVLAIG